VPDKKKLVIKKANTIIYQVKDGSDVIWEGLNITEIFPRLQEKHPDRDLSIGWRSRTGANYAK
jgi:hypothetical protein